MDWLQANCMFGQPCVIRWSKLHICHDNVKPWLSLCVYDPISCVPSACHVLTFPGVTNMTLE